MNAVVIGSTFDGLRRAAALRREGAKVTVLTPYACLGEDITQTWRCYPLSRQKALRNYLESEIEELNLPVLQKDDITPARLKAFFFIWMRQLGVSVRFMTDFAGIALSGGKLCGVIVSDVSGLSCIPCDFALDATPYHEAGALLCGDHARFAQGARATVRFEMQGARCTQDTLMADGSMLLPGGMGDGHVFVELPLELHEEMDLSGIRKLSLHRIFQYLSSCHTQGSPLEKAFPGYALPLLIDVEAMNPSQPRIPGWMEGLGGGAPDEIRIGGQSMPWREKNGKPAPDFDLFEQKQAQVCVAGLGTAGVYAAITAAREGASVIGAEQYPYPGGTRTLGGVTGLYYGNRNGLYAKMRQEIVDFSFALRPADSKPGLNPVTELLYYEKQCRSFQAFFCTRLCAAEVSENHLTRVLLIGENGVFAVRAEQFIDATGDGSLAALCGCQFDTGDPVIGAVQNYSQWNRTSSSDMGVRSIDQDVLDPVSPQEWTRAITFDTLNAKHYDLYDMLTPRESRRIRGRMLITMQQAARQARYHDALYDAYSTHDPHSKTLSAAGRMGLLPALGKARFVSIPLRAVTVNECDNLLLAGKALSFDQDAFNYIRMSADVACLGLIEGRLAARCAQSGNLLWEADLDALQKELFDLGALTYLPPSEDVDMVSPAALAAGICANDRAAFHEAILCAYDNVPSMLIAAKRTGQITGDLADRLLVLAGHEADVDRLLKTLEALAQKTGAQVYYDHQNVDGVSRGGMVDDRADENWDANQLAMILSLSKIRAAVPIIQKMIAALAPGGTWVNDLSDYALIRLDCQTLPNYDRILCLAQCACAMSDSRYTEPLKQLFSRVQSVPISGASFYKEQALLLLVKAIAICAQKVPDEVHTLTQSPYALIRKNAQSILEETNEQH